MLYAPAWDQLGYAGLVPGGGKHTRMLARHTALGTSGKTAWPSCAPVPKFGWWVACGNTSIHGSNTIVVLPLHLLSQAFITGLLSYWLVVDENTSNRLYKLHVHVRSELVAYR